MDLDVAVVGAGVSGAYSAWRLQQEKPEERIALFEYSDRVGGRLYSVTLPGLPHVKAEVGGMRYIPSSHLMVAGLVDYLKLPTKDFPMGAPLPVGARCNLFYLRGRHLRLHKLADASKVPYNLAWSERGLGPTNLQIQVMNNIYPNLGNLTLCQQMKLKVFGKPLWHYGFWDLLYRVLSNEGYQFMKDAGGYDANVANANAVTQLPATEYKDSTQFLTLRDGYDQLPITLAEQFKNVLPGGLPNDQRVCMNHCLDRIDISEGAEYPYTLQFLPTTTHERKTRVKEKTPITYRAKKMILAMPRRSLELIKSPFFEEPCVKEYLPSVLIQSAFKLFLAYERPWWRALGLVAGRSVTDLPVRQVYYFGSECDQENGSPWMNSLLMASYNDIGTVPFWKGLERGDCYKGYVPSCIEAGINQENVVPQMEFPVTDEMVRVANKQVAEVHALPEIPLPYSAVYHSWDEDPYGGGWHEWKAGYRLDEIMCGMRKPARDQDIYIVGEAYSYEQGWVEGALQTAESTLQDFFGLTWPSWLSKCYELLPNPCPCCKDLDGCVECESCGKALDAITPNCCQPIEIA